MAVKYSTGVADLLLNAVDVGFENCVVDIYSGTQPNSANDAPVGTLLARATLDGGAFAEGAALNGLNFDASVNGVLSKNPTAVWKYTGLANGTARWFRLRANGVDDNSVSTTLLRIDGSVGTSTADMILSNLTIAVGAVGTIDKFNIRRRPTA